MRSPHPSSNKSLGLQSEDKIRFDSADAKLLSSSRPGSDESLRLPTEDEIGLNVQMRYFTRSPHPSSNGKSL